MKLLNLTQGSKEWLDWRATGIGSSDAAVLLGQNPWKSEDELFEEKLSNKTEFTPNAAMIRGTKLEPVILGLYCNHVGDSLKPLVAVHSEYNRFNASFDGINLETKRLVEIKAPNPKAHAMALSGKVPHYYIPQVQWLLLVSGFEYLDYVSWDGVSKLPAIVRVYKDEKIHKELVEKGLAFLARLDKAREQGVTTKKPKVTPKKVMA